MGQKKEISKESLDKIKKANDEGKINPPLVTINDGEIFSIGNFVFRDLSKHKPT